MELVQIDLKFQMTRGDMVSALRRQALKSKVLWLILGVFALRLVMEIGYLITLGNVPDGNVFSPWLAVALLFYVIFPSIIVRLQRDPRLFQEQTWRLSDSGIEFHLADQALQWAWNELEQITFDGVFYYLRFSRQNVALIPHRVFSSVQSETEFKNLVKQKVKNNFP